MFASLGETGGFSSLEARAEERDGRGNGAAQAARHAHRNHQAEAMAAGSGGGGGMGVGVDVGMRTGGERHGQWTGGTPRGFGGDGMEPILNDSLDQSLVHGALSDTVCSGLSCLGSHET